MAPISRLENSPINGNDYGLEKVRMLGNDSSKTQRTMTKSVGLIKKDRTMDDSYINEITKLGVTNISANISTIEKRIPKFKENDDLSNLSGEDEWNEIEKYNAIAEAHDKKLKAMKVHKNQQQFQEDLK